MEDAGRHVEVAFAGGNNYSRNVTAHLTALRDSGGGPPALALLSTPVVNVVRRPPYNDGAA